MHTFRMITVLEVRHHSIQIRSSTSSDYAGSIERPNAYEAAVLLHVN